MPGRKLNKSQRRALARVFHYTAFMLDHAGFAVQLTKGPLAEHFNEALTDEEYETYNALKARLHKDAQLLHKFGIKLEGFGKK